MIPECPAFRATEPRVESTQSGHWTDAYLASTAVLASEHAAFTSAGARDGG